MSNLFRAVPHLAISHPRVPSSISLAVIRGRCRELLPTMVVIPACMPHFHTSQVWGMGRCSEVIAFLSLQTFLRPSLAKPSSTHDHQPQTINVDVSCLPSSLGVTLRLLSCLEYDIPLLSASSTMSGPNIAFSPDSIQLSGVRHCRPYNASNGTIFKLSW
jgi:hypothetical protein